MKPLKRISLARGATFADLVFRPHPDGRPGHVQALHRLADGRELSVTRGGMNFGTIDAPYEAMLDDELHYPLTGDDVTKLIT